MKTDVAVSELAANSVPPISPAALHSADEFAATKQLVLHAVSSPLTPTMYTQALEDFFCMVERTRPAGHSPVP
jgi:hypothetical protein